MYEVTEEPRAKYRFPTDPVQYAEALTDDIIEFYRKRGLLKRIQSARPAAIVLRRAWYSVRTPLKDGEQFTVDTLLELDRELSRFKTYTATHHKDTLFIALRVGRLLERAGVKQFENEVGKGRRRCEIETKWHRDMADARRTSDDRRQAILAKLKRKCSYQVIVRDLKCSKKTIAEVKRAAIKAGELTG
jgi:hypothetical protein